MARSAHGPVPRFPLRSAGLTEILRLISSYRLRRPARLSPFLDALFRRLALCPRTEAAATEDRIWDVWMHHPHRAAARELDLAASDIAARRYDIAETRLARLLRRTPDFAEAWHKRATLYYMLGRDGECLHDIRRTLELEPRHFGAMLHFAEILCLSQAPAAAQFARRTARSIHPHLTIPD
jgi:tetratricopeptide (TPR) repeat protein